MENIFKWEGKLIVYLINYIKGLAVFFCVCFIILTLEM